MNDGLRFEIPPDEAEGLVEQVTMRVLERLDAERVEHPPSPYMTIIEAAEYLRCSRQRVDDLLSRRQLTRVKDGRRTLVRRAEIESYLDDNGRK